MTVTFRRPTLVVLVAVLVIAAGVFVSQRASAASSTPVVYVATGENFPDALGSAAASAVQGGPVLLITRDSIPAVTAGELSRLSPDVIYVSGGTAVVSDAVFNALKAYAPSVVRVAGANRYETAVEVSKSAFPVTGGGSDLTALTAAVNALTTKVDALESANTTLEGEVDALQAMLVGVSRDGSTLLFTGLNLQVVNGEGFTASSNGAGNVIIGYNEAPSAIVMGYRAGSHYLVVGPRHTYTGYAGVVNGYENRSRGPYASVTGGRGNTAYGKYASVSGGGYNTASNSFASVSGGAYNVASGNASSVLGGINKTVPGNNATYPFCGC